MKEKETRKDSGCKLSFRKYINVNPVHFLISQRFNQAYTVFSPLFGNNRRQSHEIKKIILTMIFMHCTRDGDPFFHNFILSRVSTVPEFNVPMMFRFHIHLHQ